MVPGHVNDDGADGVNQQEPVDDTDDGGSGGQGEETIRSFGPDDPWTFVVRITGITLGALK